MEQDMKSRVSRLNRLLADYIPPGNTWNPADESLHQPVDLYRVPLEEAQDMQLKAIKFTFTHHYNNNDFYHKYCETRNVSPDDIKTTDDLDKIPLIPDTTFKQYPSGKDFARWLTNIFTGELPKIVIKGSNPTFDDVINAFNAAGLVVTYSSGTSGRFTVIPRDKKTFLAAEYALAKAIVNMEYQWQEDIHEYLLLPNPMKTNVFVGKVLMVNFDVIKDIQVAIDRELTAEVIQTAMNPKAGLKGMVTSYFQKGMERKMIDQIIGWLERYDRAKENILFNGAPFLLYRVMEELQKDGKSFDFGERGRVRTGGGWKVNENVRLPHADFRKQVQDVLGISEKHCLDCYGMVEGNGWMLQCPEGHYLHTPYTFYKPLVLDNDLMPTGYGEWGRFAFLDALAQSYPGFIISGDRVRLLEHCPVCDRPGPVLEPEVQRAKGEEVRGCAEEVRRVLAEDLER
jgi:long-chain-fatty-acid---luciferin-component ligase